MVRNDAFGEDGARRRCPYCCEWIHAHAVKCRHCKTALGPAPAGAGPRCGPYPDRMLLGVCSRLAVRYAAPVTAVRLGFVLLTLFHGFGILLYLVLWAAQSEGEGGEARIQGVFRSLGRLVDAVKRAVREEFSRPEGRRTAERRATPEDAGGVRSRDAR